MLGCQDFCGYYDWTFNYVQRHFGPDALHRLWAEAIGRDAQSHYAEAARAEGLAGLLRIWQHTGEEEHCDWTFTLDEKRNALRWDMRRCPSKGFLIEHNLSAAEDYCDHCMGWIVPLLADCGIEVVGHEHNHCGQCWGELAVVGRAHEDLDLRDDVRKDARWKCGQVETWKHGVKQAVVDRVSRQP